MPKHKNFWIDVYRRQEKDCLDRAAEYRRLMGLTTDREIRTVLEYQVRVQEQHARRAQDRATQAEYGHLYEEESS